MTASLKDASTPFLTGRDLADVAPCIDGSVGVEGGFAGFESYLRRQTFWINHG